MAKSTAFSFCHLVAYSAIIFSQLHAAKLEQQLQHQHQHQHRLQHGSNSKSNVSLFVFGDSYVDTGNWRKSTGISWKEPYGSTFPGKPAGRFSDGRVLTDYIASYIGIRPPIPYKWRKVVKKSYLEYGMNFAHGGTGVFDTMVSEPNMTTQIDFFQRLVEEKVLMKQHLQSSIALVSVAGNDYAAYVARNSNDLQKLGAFTEAIMDQLAINLKRIKGLGVKRIAVTLIEPIGCLPQQSASSSYKNCSEDWNSGCKFHNQLLEQTLKKLNDESNPPVFVTLDLFNAFFSALNRQRKHASGSMSMKNPLEPCCVGRVKGKYYCGSVDESGAKQYVICENPNLSLFWDEIHPSQSGWHAVYLALRSSLHKLI
ncbi:hypothetical protein DITRI_Ditri20bG0110300 [Diplodiscus trichospermus]